MLELITNEDEGTAEELSQSLDELAREGARRMIAAALEAEVEDYLHKVSHVRDERGARRGGAQWQGAGAHADHGRRGGED